MLKRAPSLTDQVKSHIKELILNGEFPDGRIPAEMELAEVLGVSRTTVRDALGRLEMEGAINRRQGAGTFVNDPVLQIRSRLEEIWSYEAMLQAHGFAPSTVVVEVASTTAGSDMVGSGTAEALNLEAHDPVLFVKKLFLENDVPVILACNVLPDWVFTRVIDQDELKRPIYELLDEYGLSRLSYYLTEIVPVLAVDDVSDLLQIAPGTPLISFDETGYDADNHPIIKSYSYFRDDLLRLRLMRRRV
ncbi:MAG: GntR family transcriptional regulator [Chloroflexota bacterium]